MRLRVTYIIDVADEAVIDAYSPGFGEDILNNDDPDTNGRFAADVIHASCDGGSRKLNEAAIVSMWAVRLDDE